MAKRVLRSFLYLDDVVVDDYLAQFEDGIIEGPYTVKDTTTGSKEGGAGLKIGVVEGTGKGSSSVSSEVSQTIRETPINKFSRLYDLMEKDGMIQTLNGFDLDIYQQIQSNEIVEVRGTAKLPQWEHITKTVSSFSGMIDIMKAIGQDPLADASVNQAYQGISALIEQKKQEGTEIIITPIGTTNFKFVATLDAGSLKRDKEHLEAEVTILGKVRRKLSKGEKIDVFRLLPRLSPLMNVSRAQRRSSSTSKTKTNVPTDSPFDEVVKYPAMQILPIAIYQ